MMDESSSIAINKKMRKAWIIFVEFQLLVRLKSILFWSFDPVIILIFEMADVHSKEMRSLNMSRIRSKNTKPELMVRKFLFTNGLRYRLHNKLLPGRPDIVLKKYHTLIFIHGCFWHKHKNCKYAYTPVSNTDYWLPKLEKNTEKDSLAIKELKKLKWRVLVIWECDLKTAKQEKTLNKILQLIKSNK